MRAGVCCARCDKTVTTAAIGALFLWYPGVRQILLGLMIVATGLESIFAFCRMQDLRFPDAARTHPC
jgi:hypothetical protein